jgi:hypothetical protein
MPERRFPGNASLLVDHAQEAGVAVPTDIANLSVWYKADAITGLSDGAQLAAWPDSSGNGYTTEQPFGVKPTYQTAELNALPVVRFKSPGDANDAALRSSAPIGATSKTIFAVVRPSQVGNTTTPQDIWAGDGGSLRLRIISSKFDLVKVGVAILVTGTTTPSDGTAYVVCATLVSATSATIHLNGTQDATATHSQTLTASSFTYLGGSGIFGGEPYFGDLAEVVVYDAALSATDRDAITSYLGSKYAITVAGGAPATTAGATVANATGAAPSSTVRIVTGAATASATGMAPTPAISTSLTVPPATANATGTSPASPAAVVVAPAVAQTTGAASTSVATSSATVTAAVAGATGAVPASSAATTVLAPAVTASAAGAVPASASIIRVTAATGAATGAALNALGTSNSNVVAVAGVAGATGTAATPGTAAVTTVVAALATGQAPAATASSSISATATVTAAQGTGQAVTASSSARPLIGSALAVGQAPAAAVLGSSSTVVTPAPAQGAGQAPTPATSAGVVAAAQRALSFAVANGAAVSVQETEPGPTIIGLAEVADAVGFTFGGSPRILVRAATASGQAAVGGGQVSGLGRRRRLQAGIPSVRHSANPGVPVRRPAASQPWLVS